MLHIDRLIKLRKDKKLIQQDMADYLQITRTAYNKYEKGKSQPSNDTVLKLANLFDVSTDYLLGNTDDPSPPEKEQKKEAPDVVNTSEALRIMVETKLGRPATQDELALVDATTDGLIDRLREQRK